MNVYESGTAALREVKRFFKAEEGDEIYLLHNEYTERWFVAEYDFELERMMENHYDGDETPESHSQSFRVWKFITSEERARYPVLYREYQPSRISVKDICRKRLVVEPEYSVTFNIG